MTKLPPGWTLASLEELAAPSPRSITDGPFGSNLKTEHYTDTGPRVVRLQNIGDGTFHNHRSHISEERYQHLLAHDVQPGDVLVAALGEILPRACVAPEWLGPAIVKADCFRFRLRHDVNPHFVAAILNSPQVRSAASTQIAGVGRPRMNLGKVRGLTIPVPPPSEQGRIVAVIGEHFSRLDGAAASLGSASVRLRSLRRAALGLAVANGEERSLAELLDDIIAGKSFRTDGRSARPDEWGVIKVSAMTWGRFLEEENKAVPATAMIDPSFEIRPGDVLLSRANTSAYVGATVYVEHCRPRLLLSDKSMRLLARPEVDPRWLNYALNSPAVRRQMSLVATGTSDSMRNISQEKVKRLELRVPPIADQRLLVDEIERRLTLIDSLATTIVRALTRLDHVRRGILQQAFSGQLVAQCATESPASEFTHGPRGAYREPNSPPRRKWI